MPTEGGGGMSVSEHESLISAARQARENAHAPYSNFRVGAALRATSGRIFGGCNVENATYGLTVCAERVAIFKAISEGERGFDAISVVTDTDTLTPPCGGLPSAHLGVLRRCSGRDGQLEGQNRSNPDGATLPEAVRFFASLGKKLDARNPE